MRFFIDSKHRKKIAADGHRHFSRAIRRRMELWRDRPARLKASPLRGGATTIESWFFRLEQRAQAGIGTWKMPAEHVESYPATPVRHSYKRRRIGRIWSACVERIPLWRDERAAKQTLNKGIQQTHPLNLYIGPKNNIMGR